MHPNWLIPIFAGVNVLLAYQDSRRLANHKTIKHGINAAVYIGLLLTVWLLYGWDWKLMAALLLTRQIFFDCPLSLFRDLKWNYITPVEKPAAIMDRLEKKIFGMNGTLMYIVYIVALLVLTIT